MLATLAPIGTIVVAVAVSWGAVWFTGEHGRPDRGLLRVIATDRIAATPEQRAELDAWAGEIRARLHARRAHRRRIMGKYLRSPMTWFGLAMLGVSAWTFSHTELVGSAMIRWMGLQ